MNVNDYLEVLADLEQTAISIGYNLHRDEGYNDVKEVLDNALENDGYIDADDVDAIELELERLDCVLYERKVG